MVEQLDKLLTSRSVSWLFGAGVSCTAGVPLMWPLTEQVMSLAGGSPHEPILRALQDELPPGTHIEHLLSYLADHIAVAERARAGASVLGGRAIERADLVATHEAALGWIADTVRWGYVPGTPARIGSRAAPLIQIDEHLAFVRSLFDTAFAGVADRRNPVRIFTTNYDTLIEDALALSGVPYWDGFAGGAVAYRSHRFGMVEPSAGYRAHVIKLHGSIDWHLDGDGKVWRVREGDLYPTTDRRVLIYPQSTKYVATQKDPFASQFDILRRQLCTGGGHVLVTCGYSFGDEHINDEIGTAMSRPDNDAALIAFVSEHGGLPECVQQWRTSRWGKHVYVLTERGVYVGPAGPFLVPAAGDRDWWTFARLAEVLANGLKEQLA